jgi:TonB family protein
VQGTVILRVTFLASGQVGSISPVKGLPNGLTEQAIAAARSIRFEPAKNNGVAQTVTKQVEYTFSIY